MPQAVRHAVWRTGIVVLLVGALGSLPTPPSHARHQDGSELSQVQRKLDAVREVLKDARADADQIARALVQADRDVADARAALAKAERRYR